MTKSSETNAVEEGKTCSTGGCDMKICSPCVMMKVVMVGFLIYAGVQYFAG